LDQTVSHHVKPSNPDTEKQVRHIFYYLCKLGKKLIKSRIGIIKDWKGGLRPGLMTCARNSISLEGRDWEDHGFRLVLAKS
jgi:hypothetical protein